MSENERKDSVNKLEEIKDQISKKHPHMKKADNEMFDKQTVTGKMTKKQAHQAEITETMNNKEIMKPRLSAFEPKPVPMRLPSGKLVIDPKFLTSNNEIFIRRMTAVEENIIIKMAGNTDLARINKAIDSIIDNCIKTNIKASDLLLIDKFTAFFKIVTLSFGKIKTPVKCPACDNDYELDLDLYEDFPITYVPANLELPFPIKLTSYSDCDLTWYITYPTLGSADTILQAMNDPETEHVAQLFTTDRFEGWLTDENGQKRDVNEDDYKALIINLDLEDKRAYRDFMDNFMKYGSAMSAFFPYCKNKMCKLFNTPQEVAAPVDQVMTTIITQYTTPIKNTAI